MSRLLSAAPDQDAPGPGARPALDTMHWERRRFHEILCGKMDWCLFSARVDPHDPAADSEDSAHFAREEECIDEDERVGRSILYRQPARIGHDLMRWVWGSFSDHLEGKV